MHKRTARHATSKRIESAHKLAELLGVDPSTVSRMAQRTDWPFSRQAPWSRNDVPKMMRWRADVLTRDGGKISSGGDPGSEAGLRRQKLEQEIRKLRANADQAETALAKERGDLHDADECELEAVRRAHLVRDSFQNVASKLVSLALSHGFPHEAAPTFQKQVEETINGCLRFLSDRAEEVNDSEDSHE